LNLPVRVISALLLLALAVAPFFLGSGFFRQLFQGVDANLNMVLASACGLGMIYLYVGKKNNAGALALFGLAVWLMMGNQIGHVLFGRF